MSLGRPIALLGVLLLGLGFLPLPAAAQGIPKVYQIDLDVSPVSGKITVPKGSFAVTYTVSVQCLGTDGTYGECQDAQGNQELQLAFTLPTTFPGGWAVSFGPTPDRIRASEAKTFGAEVRLLSDNPKKDEVAFAVSVKAQPVTPGGGLLDPLLGQAGQPSESGARVSVRKEITAAEKVTGVLRQYTWPLLLGVVIVLAAGVILRERRGHRGGAGATHEPRLHLESDARVQPASPGRGASFPVRVQNESHESDQVSLRVVDLPPGWTSILPLTELHLEPDQRTELWVTVRAPAEARAARVPFELRARSGSGHGEARLPLEVEVAAAPEARGQWADVPRPPPVAPPEPSEAPSAKHKARPGRRGP